MNKLLLLAIAIVVLGETAKGQTRKLPDTTRIKLTAPQVIAISAKVDSLQILLSNTSTLPANQIAAFNARVQQAFIVLWRQVQQQIVAEKPKTGKP